MLNMLNAPRNKQKVHRTTHKKVKRFLSKIKGSKAEASGGGKNINSVKAPKAGEPVNMDLP